MHSDADGHTLDRTCILMHIVTPWIEHALLMQIVTPWIEHAY